MDEYKEYFEKVEVIWEDAVDTSIVYKDEGMPESIYVHTLGYLIAEDDDIIHVAQHLDDGSFRNVSSIPRKYIRAIAYVVYKQVAMRDAESAAVDFDSPFLIWKAEYTDKDVA